MTPMSALATMEGALKIALTPMAPTPVHVILATCWQRTRQPAMISTSVHQMETALRFVTILLEALYAPVTMATN